ncbi:MAG: archaeal heat shock protein Hsp20 [Methanocellales archaeon]
MWRRRFFGDEFREIVDMIDRLFNAIRAGRAFEEPLYYGFSVRIGPGGEPEIRTFGNIEPTMREIRPGTREPFTDVIIDEKTNEAIVTAELPGCEKDKINVEATETSIKIEGEAERVRYYKNVSLREEIDPGSAKAMYNNGVLEIRAKLKKAARPRGFRISVK